MNFFKQYSSNFLVAFTVVAISFGCSKDKTGKHIDEELYDLASSTEGYVWFKNSDQFLLKSSGSGHNFPKLRTRFNSIAAQMLDSVGRVQSGITFPEGSVIVKELINDDNSLGRYAILFKDTDNKYADNQGWVWGYIDEDRKVVNSAVDKGSSCISCHQQADNVDYVLMNKFYP